MLPQLLLAASLVRPCPTFDDSGTIRGTVLNGSRANTPVAGAEVILQAQQDGAFIPLSQTTADERGEFVFDSLPVDDAMVFLPGASRDGVHYPGERVRLDAQHCEATTNIRVFDAVTDPSPLVARRHEIVIRTEPRLLNITETIWVSNPSTLSYVGEGKRPVTLRLHVPPVFEKITFHKEFFGRRFALIDGALVTTIPWTPGERELTFTYILPIEKMHHVWQRPLDLPCGEVRVSVVATNSRGIRCNLTSIQSADDSGQVFAHHGDSLPAGHAIQVEFGRLRVPFSTYARWVALGILSALIVVATASVFVKQLPPRTTKPKEPSACRPLNRHRRKHRELSVRGSGRATRA